MNMNSKFTVSGLTFAVSLAVGALVARRLWRASSAVEIENKSAGAGEEYQFTGAYPRNSGARNEVIQGDPEDMNGMPATIDPWSEGPIYDGSDLGLRLDLNDGYGRLSGS